MARAGSINYQVAKMIKAHNGIGLSKLESRNSSGLVSAESGHKVSDKFHSYKSLDNVRNDLTNLAKYAKAEFDIKDMSKIDKTVVDSWIKSKDITYNTASNYLSELNKVHKHMNFTREEIKELRQNYRTELQPNKLESRAYKGLDKVQLPKKSQPAFELQRDYGLRVNASTHINIDKQLNGNTLKYQEKGGKWSEKEINPALVAKIKANAVNGRYNIPGDTYYGQLKREIKKTGQKFNGSHGMRHSFAQNKIDKDGWTKKQVSEALGHSREEITNTYIR